MQPGLSALLAHDAVGTPGCQRIVEALVSGAHGLLRGQRQPRVIKAGQVAHAVIGCGRHHPRVTPLAENVSKSAIVLEKKNRLRRECGVHRVPIDGVGKIDVEVCHHRLALLRHVSGRGKVSLFDILQLADKRLLWRATGAGIPLDRALIHHDGESESGMSFGLGHHLESSLVGKAARPVPVDDDAIDAAADHIGDLAVYLRGIGRVVTHVHVVRAAEPYHHVSVDFGGRARIQQRVDVDFAHIPGGEVSVGLRGKAVGGAGVVRRLCGQRGGGIHKVLGRAQARGQCH